MAHKNLTQMSKSTNNLNHLSFDNNASSTPPPPPPFVLDSSPNNRFNAAQTGLTSSASSNRINPNNNSAAAASGTEKPTKPSTFSMLTKGFKHIFSTDSKSKDKDKDGFTRDNVNYQSERLGNSGSAGRAGASAESPSSPDESKTLNRSESSSQIKGLGSMSDYAIYDEAPPLPNRPDRASGSTPTTPPSIISTSVGQSSFYGQQMSNASQRSGGGALPHSQTTSALMNHHQSPSEPSSNAVQLGHRPTAPTLPSANAIESDELNEIDRLVDFTTNEERVNLQKKGCDILTSQIETKKARIVSMEADIIELRHLLEQYKSPGDIDRLKHEIRELTNEKATLELRIIQNSSWSCTKCTVLNKSDSVTCEICGNDKADGEIIICEKCQEKNPLYKLRCKKCGSHLLSDAISSNENSPAFAGAGAASLYNDDGNRGGGNGEATFIRPSRPAPPIPPRRTTSNSSNPSVPHTPQTPSPQVQNMNPYMFNGQQPTIPHVPGSTATPAAASYNHINQNVYFPRTPLSYNSNLSPQAPAQAQAPQPSPRGNNPQQSGNGSTTRI